LWVSHRDNRIKTSVGPQPTDSSCSDSRLAHPACLWGFGVSHGQFQSLDGIGFRGRRGDHGSKGVTIINRYADLPGSA
jgi:hypothetical protein